MTSKSNGFVQSFLHDLIENKGMNFAESICNKGFCSDRYIGFLIVTKNFVVSFRKPYARSTTMLLFFMRMHCWISFNVAALNRPVHYMYGAEEKRSHDMKFYWNNETDDALQKALKTYNKHLYISILMGG